MNGINSFFFKVGPANAGKNGNSITDYQKRSFGHDDSFCHDERHFGWF